MNVLEFLDRAGERRHERAMRRGPTDYRIGLGVLFFVGYYLLVFAILRSGALPEGNGALVRDAMLVLGPVVGAIGQALFRTDKRDEIAANNTGEAFRAQRAQAEATTATAAAVVATAGQPEGNGTNA